MEDFFNSLDRFFKSIDSLFDRMFHEERENRFFKDKDFYEAWEELDDYIRSGRASDKSSGNFSDKSSYRTTGRTRGNTTRGLPEELRQDYLNLETKYGESFDKVKQSYKRLLKKYHPDNFAEDPEKFRIATEITKKLNISYNRIKDFQEKNSRKGQE